MICFNKWLQLQNGPMNWRPTTGLDAERNIPRYWGAGRRRWSACCRYLEVVQSRVTKALLQVRWHRQINSLADGTLTSSPSSGNRGACNRWRTGKGTGRRQNSGERIPPRPTVGSRWWDDRRQDNVAIRRMEARNKVYGDVGPRAMWDRKWRQQTRWGLGWGGGVFWVQTEQEETQD